MACRTLAVTLTLTFATTATADPAAEAVRDKVRAAVGYDAYRKLEHGVLLEGKTEDLVGAATRFRWQYHADGRYVRFTESKLAEAEGYDGKLRWFRHLANPALPIELAFGDRRRLWNAIAANHWLAPTGGYMADIDLAESRAYRPCLLVRHPECHGATARVYIDPQTWLPTQFTFFAGGAATVVELSDYREISGTKVAGRVAINRYGGLGHEFVVTAAKPAPPIQESENTYAMPPRHPDTRFASSQVGVEARAAKHGLLVRPVLNGKQAGWFAVQTASPLSYITVGEADRLGLPLSTHRTAPKNGAYPIRVRSTDRFALGPAAVEGLLLYDLPEDGMAVLSRLIGVEVRGLLGNDVLSRMVVEASWSGGTMAVHDPVRYKSPDGLSWQPVRFDNLTPFLQATFEGRHTGLFGLASGSDCLDFEPSSVRSLRLLMGREVVKEATNYVEGEVTVTRGVGQEFRVFDRVHRSVRTQFVTEEGIEDRYPYALGMFGPAVLGPGTVVFDYPNRRIGFLPRP